MSLIWALVVEPVRCEACLILCKDTYTYFNDGQSMVAILTILL